MRTHSYCRALQIAFTALCIVLPQAVAFSEANRPVPTVDNGVLDLANWDFSRDGPVGTQGQWFFAWGVLLDPAPWAELEPKLSGQAPVPMNWDLIPSNPKLPDSDNLPPIGSATYALKVNQPEGSLPGVSIDGISTAATLSLVDIHGRVLAEKTIGHPSADINTSKPVSHGLIQLEIPAEIANRSLVEMPSQWYLLLRISNFHDQTGGIWNTPELADSSSLRHRKQLSDLRTRVMFGVLFIIGAYHLILFAQRRDDVSALCFGVFCLTIGARTFSMGIAQDVGLAGGDTSYQWLTTIEYLSMPIMVVTALNFIHVLLPAAWFSRVVQVVGYGLSVPLLLLTLLSPKMTFGSFLTVFQLQILAALIGILIHLIIRVRYGNRLAAWSLLAFALIASGAVNDILHSNNVIETTHIAPYTMMGFVLMQAGILSARNAAIARERDALNATKLEVLRKSEEAARVKSEFLANMSHELRTPLNALCNIPKALLTQFAHQPTWHCQACGEDFADDGSISDSQETMACPECETGTVTRSSILTFGGDPTEHHHYLERLDGQANELLGLVERVLSFNDLSSDQETALDLNSLNAELDFAPTFRRYQAIADTKYISLEISIELEDHPLMVDVDKVVQCLEVLLDNAIKFTPTYGEVACQVSCNPSGGLLLMVSDNGIGIAVPEQREIFNPFYQVESSHTREYGGAGLGLALALEICNAHGGTIKVESAPDKGSIFTASFERP